MCGWCMHRSQSVPLYQCTPAGDCFRPHQTRTSISTATSSPAFSRANSDMTSTPDIEPENLYLLLRDLCLVDHRGCEAGDHDVLSLYLSPDTEDYMEQLRKLAENGDDFPLRLELALRHLAGLETQGRMSPEGALSFLDPIIYLRGPEECPEPKGPPISLCAAAYSLAAYAHYEKYLSTQEKLDLDLEDAAEFSRDKAPSDTSSALRSVMRAVHYASVAASLQFLTPAVLLIGSVIKTDLQVRGINCDQFKQFRPLWRAVDKRAAEQAEHDLYEAKSQETATESPGHLYDMRIKCAASSCSAEHRKGRILTPCGGDCSVSSKSWYCSEACRIIDLPAHGTHCKIVHRALPPTLPLNERTREQIIDILMPVCEPVLRYEILADDEYFDDPRDGTLMWIPDTPSPYTPGKMVRCVLRLY
ncbi:hypothetical protein C8Q79DRAFT_994386 [Trametes meyenii]|nr:hypothetical protein C8Q79DRAFT_994386 [Trametes meyenii]